MSEPGLEGHQRFDCTGADQADLDAAAEAAGTAIDQGECIVMPTDTVYGIGADAFSTQAVQRLLDVKERGRDMPPPVLISDASLIRALAVSVPQSAKDLVEKHWPGPLTVICKAQPSLRMDLGDTEGTIALRVPDHPLALEVLRRTGPMAVSSANISGRKPSQSCDEALAQFGDKVAVYLDGGTVGPAATPSTIVDFTQEDYGQVLRHGALSVELLRQTCPGLEDLVEQAAEPDPESDDETNTETDPETEPGEGHLSPDRQPEDGSPDAERGDVLASHVWADEGGSYPGEGVPREPANVPQYLGEDDGDVDSGPGSSDDPSPASQVPQVPQVPPVPPVPPAPPALPAPPAEG